MERVPKEQRIEIGNRLRRLRKAKGLTTADVARLAGVSQSTYSCYENGLRMPSLKTLNKLANVLGVTTDFIVRDTAGEMRDLKELFNTKDLHYGGVELKQDELKRVQEFLEFIIRERLK